MGQKAINTGRRVLRSLTSSLLLAVIYVTPALAQDPPDEVNVPKYQNMYTEAKKISDVKRARANDLLSKAQAIDVQIRQIRDTILSKTKSLEDKKSLKARLEVEKPQLAAANEGLAAENRRNQTDIDYNASILQRLYGERRDLEYNIQREEGIAAQIWQRVEELNREVERLSRAKNQLDREFDRARSELRDLEERLHRSERRLEEANIGIASAHTEIRQNESELNGLRSQTSGLQQAINSAQASLDSKRNQLAPLEGRLNQLKTDLQWAEGHMGVMTGRLAEARRNVDASADEIERLRIVMNRIQDEISTLERLEQTDEVKRQIESKRSEHQGHNSRRNQLIGNHASLERERDYQHNEYVKAEDHLRLKRDEHARIKNEFDTVRAEVVHFERELQAAKTAFNSNTQRISNLERAISELTQRIARLEHARNELAHDIDQLSRAIPRHRQEVRELSDRLDRVSRALADTERERQVRVNDYDRQEQLVKRLRSDHQDLQYRIGQLENKNNELAEQIRDNEGQIARNRDVIRRNLDTIAMLSREIPALETEIATLQRSLPPLFERSEQAWADFKPVDEDAAKGEQETATKYAKYLSVKAEYDRRMQVAKESGATQGDAHGRADGNQKGDVDGQVSGTQEGAAAGKREGLEFGYQQGQAAGTKQGDIDGYQHGRNYPPNYNEGLELGLKQGDQDAWDHAHRTEYPRARADQRTEFFNRPPPKQVDLDNNLSEGSNPHQLSRGGGDSFFFSVASNRDLGTHVRGRNSFVTQISVSLAKPNCENGWKEFNEACMASYKGSYQHAFDLSYKAAYNSSYSVAFKSAHDTAFEQNKAVRYGEGYKLTYPVSYATGDKRGAKDAQNQGAIDGQKLGYSRTIEGAKVAEYKKGIDDETALFASAPVVRLLGASMIEENAEGDPGELVPGDLLTLTVDTANFGAKVSARGHVKIQWVAMSNNIAVQSGVLDLTGISGETRARVRNVGLAKISPSAAPGSEVKLKVAFTSDSGGYQEQVLAATVAKGYASVVEEIDTEDTPKLAKTIDLKVKLRSKSPEISFQDLRVELRSDEPSNIVRLDVKEEINTKRLKPNDDLKFKKLKYTILDSTAVGRKVTFKVVVFHGKNVTARSTVSVIPKAK